MASKESEHTIAPCLEALCASCEGLDAEIIVASALLDNTAAVIRNRFPGVAVVLCPPEALVPVLWDAGLRRARGRYVAFTTAECAVERSWARRLLAGVRAGAAGAGGFFELSRHADALTRAVFYLRYSAFITGDAARRDEIAGDNACYRRDVLERFHDRGAGGFWEVETHRKLRAAGEHLVTVHGAVARLLATPGFGALAAARFAHGRRFGAWRVSVGGVGAWRIVVGAPLVPAVLALRAGRRIAVQGSHLPRFITALPLLLALAACWAAGEAFGAAAMNAGGRPKEVTA